MSGIPTLPPSEPSSPISSRPVPPELANNKGCKIGCLVISGILAAVVGICAVAVMVNNDPGERLTPERFYRQQATPTIDLRDAWDFQQEILVYCMREMVKMGALTAREYQAALIALERIKDAQNTTRLALVLQCIEEDLMP